MYKAHALWPDDDSPPEHPVVNLVLAPKPLEASATKVGGIELSIRTASFRYAAGPTELGPTPSASKDCLERCWPGC
jgi:hypothetical protein